MSEVLNELYKVVKKGGKVLFVVGDKKVHGKLINGAEFFNDITPFKIINTIERSYTGSSSQVFDKLNKTDRKEQIIVWEK
jgi:ubiquinone/menaquinone biosynthesis C-methylase UbiE